MNLGTYPSYYIANEGFVALKALVKPWKTLGGVQNESGNPGMNTVGGGNFMMNNVGGGNFINVEEIVEIGLLRMFFKSEGIG